jgi:deazaflavin-dependent oxidoreductase (nitroreductase family)
MPALLGLRRKPGAIALTVLRFMPKLYRIGLGRLFGRSFVLLTHKGRKSGKTYRTALKVVEYDRSTGEVVVFSMYGGKSDWMRNIVAAPAVQIEIGGRRFRPSQRFLTEDERVAAALRFRQHHPVQFRLFSVVFGWGRLASKEAMRAFVKDRPFVAFRPIAVGA